MLAESRRTVRIEGNHYFPVADLDTEFLVESTTVTVCPWKGQARYYDVVVDGAVNRDAAWYYPRPSRAAEQIAGHVAFWHGVRVETVRDGQDAQDAQDEGGRGALARLRGRLRSGA